MKVINDLFDYENYKIVQDSDSFKFSIDSILISEYVNIKKKSDIILDLCTGNAVSPLILSYYYQNKIVGFEINKKISNYALESVSLNNKNNQIEIINDDIKNIKKYFLRNSFDIILANPPYFKYNTSSLINEDKSKAMARHEISLNLENIFEIVDYALKDRGNFYLVHLPERLEEILYLCEKYKIRAKEIQFIETKTNEKMKIVLIKCVKNGNNKLDVYTLNVKNLKSYKNIFRK